MLACWRAVLLISTLGPSCMTRSLPLPLPDKTADSVNWPAIITTTNNDDTIRFISFIFLGFFYFLKINKIIDLIINRFIKKKKHV
jgi:hypothetical protein